MHTTMLTSYSTRNLYILVRISTGVRLPVHANLLARVVSHNSYLHVFHYFASEMTHVHKFTRKLVILVWCV